MLSSLTLAMAGALGLLPIVLPPSTQAPTTPDTIPIALHREVLNLEHTASNLRGAAPPFVKQPPRATGTLWWGSIMRRLPGEGPSDDAHYVPFAIQYQDGIASRAWCDANMNGDLTDDPAVGLSQHPSQEGARSFLADLRWPARAGSKEIAIDWKVRVVLEPSSAGAEFPYYRVQMVYGMTGTVTLEGRPHLVVLYDGSGDGLYSKEFGDGLFVDLDDDRHFEVNELSPEFGPFSVPFQMGGRIYEATAVAMDGSRLELRAVGAAEAPGALRIGSPAPDFLFRDLSGKETRLKDLRGNPAVVYFWASWCGVSSRQAPDIAAIYDRFHPAGLQVLGVSYDTDRGRLEEFRRKNRQPWPTSFSGRMLWEDPVGHLYQVDAPGVAFLVDRNGILEGRYTEMGDLGARLEQLLAREAASMP